MTPNGWDETALRMALPIFERAVARLRASKDPYYRQRIEEMLSDFDALASMRAQVAELDAAEAAERAATHRLVPGYADTEE